MDNLDYLIIGLIAGLIIVVVHYIITAGLQSLHDIKMDKKDLELKEKSVEIEMKKLDISADINEESFALLDIVIQKSIDDYLIMNPKFIEAEYLNSELQTELNKGIGNRVADRLSPSLLNKFSMIYNMDKFSDILAEKVYIRTLYIVVERNKMKK